LDTETNEIYNLIDNKLKKTTQNPLNPPNPPNEQYGQYGGTKNNNKQMQIVGSRRVITHSELSYGGGTSDSSMNSDVDSEFSEKLNAIARTIDNKASEAHEASLKKIKKNLNIDNDEEAKAIKAILYNKIKTENPMLSNLDKAMELEKMTSDVKILKSLKKQEIDEMIQKIKKIKDEKDLKTSSVSSTTSATSATSKSSKSSTHKNPSTNKKSLVSRALGYKIDRPDTLKLDTDDSNDSDDSSDSDDSDDSGDSDSSDDSDDSEKSKNLSTDDVKSISASSKV
jgi:hypothetical protein